MATAVITCFFCSSLPHLPLPIRYPAKKGNRRAVLPGNGDSVVGNMVAEIFFGSDSPQFVMFPDGCNMFDAAMYGYRMAALRIAGKGKSAVSQREGNAAMRHTEAVEHLATHPHFQGAGALLNGYEFHAHPLTKRVVVEHPVKNFFWTQMGGMLIFFHKSKLI